MKRLIGFLSLSLLILMALTPLISRPVASAAENEKIRVMVEYRPGRKSAVERALTQAGGEFHYAFDDLNTFALTLPVAALDGISRNPHVVSIEEDPERHLMGVLPPVLSKSWSLLGVGDPFTEQVIPYGIDMVQARDVWDANRDGVVDEGAPTGAGMTVCIIDTGYYQDHLDLPNAIGGYSQVDDNWARDGYGHGSHVAGTISALNNEVGVVGVTPGTVDLFIIKYFADDGNATTASDLIDASNRCADAGANIISMSLGGGRSSRWERIAFEGHYADGILSVASAGNDGDSVLNYPASYDSVISVAAIDDTMTVADFSNFNSQVELAAPGVGVLSTIPYIETNSLVADGMTYASNHIEFSAYGEATGALVDGGLCATAGAWSGNVVLCQRGDYDFSVKVNSVAAGGGVAAVIYNNEPGNFLGTMGEGNSSEIVGISISQEDGQYLVANKLGQSATVTSTLEKPASGYEAWDGTSMSAPHVSGAAALVWSCLPTATNVQVREALTSTAFDLGTTGRDDYYGFGLVQAFDACNELNPTSVDLLSFTAEGGKRSVTLRWETANEIDNLGFNLYRAESPTGERIKINPDLIPTLNPPGSLLGARYEFVDSGADLRSGKLLPNRTYYYWLEDVDIYDGSELHGPAVADT